MNILEILYNILEPQLTIPNIYAGTANGDARAGLITFFQLPGSGINFADGLGVTQIQFDIWHADIYSSDTYKEELIAVLLGSAGVYDGKALIFNIETDLGNRREDDGQIWHSSIQVGIRWNRR